MLVLISVILPECRHGRGSLRLLAPTTNRDSRLGTELVLSKWAALALGLPGLRLVLLGLRLFANLLERTYRSVTEGYRRF